jgi:oligoribonuclease
MAGDPAHWVSATVLIGAEWIWVRKMPKVLVWCDLETTGLVPGRDKLLEVAFAVTDTDLQVLWQDSWVLPCPDLEPVYVRTSAFVQKMHEKNGLWADVHQLTEELTHTRQSPIAQTSAEFVGWLGGEILQKLSEFGIGVNSRARMHGFNPSFDLGFLAECMPELYGCFEYNKGDVRALEHFCLLWGKEKHKPINHNHRAADDLADEIAAAAHYRSELGL